MLREPDIGFTEHLLQVSAHGWVGMVRSFPFMRSDAIAIIVNDVALDE